MDTIGERLRAERERLDFSQAAFGAIGGVAKRAQIRYEQDERAPDAKYLAAVAKVGVDVRYVVTGDRKGPPLVKLSEEETTMLSHWREASKAVRRAALGALLSSGDAPPKAAPGVVIHGEVGQSFQGEITQSSFSVDMGKQRKPGEK